MDDPGEAAIVVVAVPGKHLVPAPAVGHPGYIASGVQPFEWVRPGTQTGYARIASDRILFIYLSRPSIHYPRGGRRTRPQKTTKNTASVD